MPSGSYFRDWPGMELPDRPCPCRSPRTIGGLGEAEAQLPLPSGYFQLLKAIVHFYLDNEQIAMVHKRHYLVGK
jgi:hypothetical protein